MGPCISSKAAVFVYSKTAVQGCSQEKLLWKFLENSNEKSSCRAFRLIKLQADIKQLYQVKISSPHVCSLFNIFKTAKSRSGFFYYFKRNQGSALVLKVSLILGSLVQKSFLFSKCWWRALRRIKTENLDSPI